MPSCELCGREMKGPGRSMTIEGALMVLCPECAARFGYKPEAPTKSSSSRGISVRPSWLPSREREAPPTTSPSVTPRPRPVQLLPKPKPRPKRPVTLDEMILIEDYATVIRSARQKAKISQDELAQKVGERISTLQAIEAGRLKPVEKVIRGLERELGISLLEPIGVAPVAHEHDKSEDGTTLGDVVKVKRKKSQKT
jgi:putative transcription factor